MSEMPVRDAAGRRHAPRRARLVATPVVVALAAVLSAKLLGEYDFSGNLPWLAGPVLGVVLAEVALAVAGSRPRWMGPVAGLLAAGALWWAAYIASGEGLRPVPGAVWPAMGLTVVAGVLWVGGPPAFLRRRP